MNQDMTNYVLMKVFKKMIANTLLVQKRNPKPNRNGTFDLVVTSEVEKSNFLRTWRG